MPAKEVNETQIPVFSQVLTEQRQGAPTRKLVIERIELILGRPLVTFFTSFRYPVSIEDNDVELLEGVLQTMDLSDGLALLISSPGGSGIAAERIINICRSYSGKGEYWAIVPSRAKSAATMICLGASKIYMAASSELGPVDPQFIKADEKGERKSYSIHDIVSSYDRLFNDAVSLTEGNLEPYLQKLKEYHPWDMEMFKKLCSLSKDIAVQALKTGMMTGLSDQKIQKNISMFLTTKETKVHERPIYIKDALNCQLTVEAIDAKASPLWKLIYELYIRTNNYVSTEKRAKCIESRSQSMTGSISEAV